MVASKENSEQNNQPPSERRLRHLILRVAKDQAAFLYFQLEANEGLAFYSTLDVSLREAYRDIELFSPESLNDEINHFLKAMESQVSPLIVLDEMIEDSPEAIDKFSKGGKKTL